jgi:LL-diaminopimelate aminotransferase
MKKRFNVEMDPDKEIFSLIGSKEGLANLVRAITTPCNEDVILVPDPIYASYWEFIKCAGAIGHPIPLTKKNNYMPDMNEVWASVKDPKKIKAMVINYPNNPLGAVATREYVQSIVDFCKEKDILLISDMAYSEIYFDEAIKPFSVFEMDGAKDVAVEFFSFSKPYALTGWRMGWICGNSEVVMRFGKAKSTVDNGSSKVIQTACAELLNSKEGQEYIDRENLNYKRKQEFMVKGFKELGYPLENVPAATFYLWLPIPPRYKTSLEFCYDLLETSGVVIVPGSSFGKCGEGFFRVSYVCSEKDLETVLERFKDDGFQY